MRLYLRGYSTRTDELVEEVLIRRARRLPEAPAHCLPVDLNVAFWITGTGRRLDLEYFLEWDRE